MCAEKNAFPILSAFAESSPSYNRESPLPGASVLNEICDCLFGHGRSWQTEVVAKKVEAAFDPADEILVWVLLLPARSAAELR